MTDHSRMSCSQPEFEHAFRREGFLSRFMDEAATIYTSHHAAWFEHAEALNRAGLDAFNRRDDVVIGLTTHDPKALAIRMTYRALSALQAAIILYRRGMIAEGDTLTRNIYETMFWLGFIEKDADAAERAFLNDERKSQRDRANYYREQFESGALDHDAETVADLNKFIDELKAQIVKADDISVKEVARKSGLYAYYDAYKHLSASSAHNSLKSLHRYLTRNPDGSYDGHTIGPDPDALDEALSVLCVGAGVALAMFCTVVEIDDDEAELQALLIKTDELRHERQGEPGSLILPL